MVPVAVFGSEEFDVRMIDVTTLEFGDATPAHDLTDSFTYEDHIQDVNLDGYEDLVSHYRQRVIGLASSDTEACLTAAVYGSATGILSCDSVRPLH